GKLREIAPERLQGRRLDFLLVLGLRAGTRRATGGGFFATFAALAAGELRVELAQDFVARPFDVDVERLQHPGGHALTLAKESEQDVFGADVGVIERLRLLAREREDLLHARRVGNAV